MLTTGGQIYPLDVGILSHLNIHYPAPLYAGQCGVCALASGGAGLATNTPLEIGDHHIARHTLPPTRRTATRTRSAPEPVASVSSNDSGVRLLRLGKPRSLA